MAHPARRAPSRHAPARATDETTWHHASAARPFSVQPPPTGETRADVVIVGGGFTGLSAALDLAQAGLSVAVLEAATVGAGASGRNGGLVCSGWRKDQATLEARLGRETADRLWAFSEHAKADLLARMTAHAIDADWRAGQIFCAHNPSRFDELVADAAFMAERHGHPGVVLDRAQTADALGTDVFVGATRDPTAGQVHPLKLAYGLAAAAVRAGAAVHEGARVIEVGQAGAARFARTETGVVRADHVLLCGDGLLDGLAPSVEARVLPIGSFVLATEPLDPALGVMPGGESAMDTRFVVNYWRRSPEGRLIFGGGETYTPSWPADIAAFVRANLLKIYPALSSVRVTHAWGGALGLTTTRLPWVREVAPGVFSASGYSGQGVALAPLMGRVLAEAVRGRMERFDLVARLPAPPFPGGRALRWPLLTAALTWYALRDRLG